ncbi:MAG: Grx4 family monothiol glutaredoxin [Deltaproteobacteria bacterium]|nr:Grx4 family monothiol glutaredoxin [Deltaproteobacteria bacterium]
MDAALKNRIMQEITSSPIMIYMKGTREMPQCGFSNQVVQIFKTLDVPFATSNVLEDQTLRDGIKEYANWPTIPQVYVAGEFIGGCDIITEMYQSGELQTLLKEKCGDVS